jgi:hypothetical protein
MMLAACYGLVLYAMAWYAKMRLDMDTFEVVKLIPVISAALVILEKLYGYGQSFLKNSA